MKSSCVPSSPCKFEQPKIAFEEEKSCTNSKKNYRGQSFKINRQGPHRMTERKMTFDVPQGYNSTRNKGIMDIDFLPGQNIKIVKR